MTSAAAAAKKRWTMKERKEKGGSIFKGKKINMMIKITYIHIISTGNDS
jgi:hypothetical protein